MSPGIKIIASSGLIEKQINVDNAETAVNAFIEKPYTAERLMSVVSSIVKGTEIVSSDRDENNGYSITTNKKASIDSSML